MFLKFLIKKNLHLSKRYYLTILFLLLAFNQSIHAQSKFVDSVLNWVDSHPKVDSQYILTLHRLSYVYSENDIKKSFAYYERVSTLSDSLNFTYGKSLAQINLGLLLSSSGNFDASNNAYFKAIEYAEKCNGLRLQGISLNNIGENFSSLKDYEKCRGYTKQAIKINMQLAAWRGVAVNYELLQQCDLGENLYAKGKQNLDLGISYALKANEPYILSQYYLGYGKIQAIYKNRDSAEYYFSHAMQQADLGNNLRNKYQVYKAKSEYLQNLSFDQKIELLDSAYLIARRTNYLEGIAQAAEQLSDVYETKKRKDSSLFYYHIYRSSYDSIFSENNKRNTIIQEADWMIKRKEIENTHLKQLSAIQKGDIIFKNTLLFTIGILSIIAIISLFIIYKNTQSRKKRIESSLQQKITEIKMQSLRAQMNPHFIFNSLNSIENFIMQNDKMAASEYLNKFAKLIRIILDSSRTELIPFSKSVEGIRLYVELEQLRFNNKFTFKLNIDPELLNGDYEVPSLLAQPYIENAILHGISHSETESLFLNLTAKLENEYIIYSITDNGIGRKLSKEYNSNNRPDHQSVGLKLIEERISIFNHQQNSDGGVVITDLYDDDDRPLGTRIDIKIKAI